MATAATAASDRSGASRQNVHVLIVRRWTVIIAMRRRHREHLLVTKQAALGLLLLLNHLFLEPLSGGLLAAGGSFLQAVFLRPLLARQEHMVINTRWQSTYGN